MEGCDYVANVNLKRIILIIAAIACLFCLAACGEPNEADIRENIVNKVFVYEKEGFGSDFTIIINDDGSFSYYEGGLSSYIGVGKWSLDGAVLTLTDEVSENYPFVNHFKVKNGDLVYIAEDSTNFLYVKVADGEHFEYNFDMTDEVLSGK